MTNIITLVSQIAFAILRFYKNTWGFSFAALNFSKSFNSDSLPYSYAAEFVLHYPKAWFKTKYLHRIYVL